MLHNPINNLVKKKKYFQKGHEHFIYSTIWIFVSRTGVLCTNVRKHGWVYLKKIYTHRRPPYVHFWVKNHLNEIDLCLYFAGIFWITYNTNKQICGFFMLTNVYDVLIEGFSRLKSLGCFRNFCIPEELKMVIDRTCAKRRRNGQYLKCEARAGKNKNLKDERKIEKCSANPSYSVVTSPNCKFQFGTWCSTKTSLLNHYHHHCHVKQTLL